MRPCWNGTGLLFIVWVSFGESFFRLAIVCRWYKLHVRDHSLVTFVLFHQQSALIPPAPRCVEHKAAFLLVSWSCLVLFRREQALSSLHAHLVKAILHRCIHLCTGQKRIDAVLLLFNRALQHWKAHPSAVDAVCCLQ